MCWRTLGVVLIGLTCLVACDSSSDDSSDDASGTVEAQGKCTADAECVSGLFCYEDKCVISEDPCVGIDFQGICDGDIVTWCEDQSLKGIDCAANSEVCDFNPEKGLFDCVEPQ